MRMRSPFLVASTAALLAGCSSGPDFERPAKPAATSYTAESLAPRTSAAGSGPGREAQTFVPSMDIPGEWWTLFHSPQLDVLVREALRANPDIDAAQAALRQARDSQMILGRLAPVEKVASFLLVLSAREAENGRPASPLHLAMTRTDIADYLGLTIETVSRSFTKLRLQGLIHLPDAHHVEIVDRRALTAVAGISTR